MGCKRKSYGRKRKLNYSVGMAASEIDGLQRDKIMKDIIFIGLKRMRCAAGK
jgi:hypothetical protein